MSVLDDPFEVLTIEEAAAPPTVAALPVAATARFHGFDVDDQPLLAGVPALPHEIVPARATVPLQRADVGRTVVVLFENGDPRRPIVLGVLQDGTARRDAPAPSVSVNVDDEQLVLRAEREIVLRCGDASITLTRAGKVIIKGKYVVSHSTGYNKIKGGAVDIN